MLDMDVEGMNDYAVEVRTGSAVSTETETVWPTTNPAIQFVAGAGYVPEEMILEAIVTVGCACKPETPDGTGHKPSDFTVQQPEGNPRKLNFQWVDNSRCEAGWSLTIDSTVVSRLHTHARTHAHAHARTRSHTHAHTHTPPNGT